MSIHIDASELNRFAADLGRVPSRVVPLVRKAVEVSARNVKDDARALAKAQSGRHAARYPYAMNYELRGYSHRLVADIFPRAGGQGSLAPLFETGNPFSGRKPALEPALRANLLDFAEGLAKAGEEAFD